MTHQALLETIIAARLYGPTDLRYERIRRPALPDSRWVRVQVQACAVCGTDREAFRSGPNLFRRSASAAPLTLGHEIIGRIIQTSADSIHDLGERVALDGNLGCMNCEECAADRIHRCVEWEIVGLTVDGGLATELIVPDYTCIRVDDRVPTREAVLIEPLSVAVKAMRTLSAPASTSLLINGAGAIGLLIVQAAIAQGVRDITCIDPDENRRVLARRFGATHTLSPEQAAQQQVRTDSIIECSGAPTALGRAVRHLTPGGQLVAVGLSSELTSLDAFDLVMNEKQVRGSVAHSLRGDFTTAAHYVNTGRVDLTAFPVHEISFTSEALNTFTHPDQTLRTAFIMDTDQSQHSSADSERVPTGIEAA